MAVEVPNWIGEGESPGTIMAVSTGVLRRIRFTRGPESMPTGTVTLAIVSGADRIRVWRDPAMAAGDLLLSATNPTTNWALTGASTWAAIPTNIWIEAVTNSATLGDTLLAARFSCPTGSVLCADTNVFTVPRVDTIEAFSPAATNSSQFFDGGKTDFGDPCSGGLSPGQSLIVFFDTASSIDLVTSNEVVNDFDVVLKTHVLPSSITADDLSESWAKVSGPISGSFDYTNTFEVKYQNPKKGGLYQFELDLGVSGYPTSGANLLLPLAGAESSAFVQSEFARIRTWVDNQLPDIPIADRLFAILLLRRAMTVSANLDYGPGDWVGGESPCMRYTVYGGETLTVEGVVMSSPKLANMMWGVMCRRFMYWDWFTNLGADIRNRIDYGILSGDSDAAKNSYELGRDLSEDGIGALHNRMREYRDLIREPNAVEFRLFPSEDTLSAPPIVPTLP